MIRSIVGQLAPFAVVANFRIIRNLAVSDSNKFDGWNFHGIRPGPCGKTWQSREMPEKYRIHLTESERSELKALVTAGKAAAPERLRAQILLAADEAHPTEP